MCDLDNLAGWGQNCFIFSIKGEVVALFIAVPPVPEATGQLPKANLHQKVPLDYLTWELRSGSAKLHGVVVKELVRGQLQVLRCRSLSHAASKVIV